MPRKSSSKSESPDIAPLNDIGDIQDNPLAEPKVNVKPQDKTPDQPNVDPVPEPKQPLVKGDPDYNVLDGVDNDDWKYHSDTEIDQANKEVDRLKREANRPKLDPSFFQDQNPDMVGNPRYQPQMPDMNLRHDSTSYSKRDNLINHTRTKIKQEDPDGNVWKTSVDTERQRNWYNRLL